MDDATVSLLVELPENTHQRLLEYLESDTGKYESQDAVVRKALNVYLDFRVNKTRQEKTTTQKTYNKHRPSKPIKNLNVHRYDSNAMMHSERMETFRQLLDSIASDVARTERRFINTDDDLERIKDSLVDYFERALMKALSRT